MPIKLIAPTHTPLDESGNLNLRVVEAQARHLAGSGVSGVFLCGSTGEGMSLTCDERKEVTEAWVELAALHELDIIVQVGANCQRDAIELANHAAKLGVRGISAHAPCYFLPKSVDDLIHFFVPIAEAAGSAAFYYYDIPELTGVQLPTAEFLRRGTERLPNLAGVKYTNSDLAQFQECLLVADGRFELWFGCDEALLAGYSLGACGAVGSTYNFMAPLYHRLVAAFDAGDQPTARALQAQTVQVVRALGEYGYAAAAKAVMEWYGIDCGPVRPPLRALTAEQRREILARLKRMGFPFADSPAAAPDTPSGDGQVVIKAGTSTD